MDKFKEVIENYLNQFAAKNLAFAKKLANPEKNIEGCLQYILSEVQKAKRTGFADEEIYGFALHYYEEEEVEINKTSECRVVVNQAILADEAPKPKAQEEVKKKPIAKKIEVSANQISLF